MFYHQHHSWLHSAMRDAAGLALKPAAVRRFGVQT